MTLTHNGRPLRPDEVPCNLRHHFYESTDVPSYRIPKYDTGDRLFTRDDLLRMFEQEWGHRRVNDGDVHRFVVLHFTEGSGGTSHIVPTDIIPFPPMPDIDEDVDHLTRMQIIREHEERRSNSKRYRQLFRIDGLPKFVPSNEHPSVNEPRHVQQQKVDRIHAL